MEIKTKFNVEDSVYFMMNNRVKIGTIESINITLSDEIIIKYKVSYSVNKTYSWSKSEATKNILEEDIALTQEELLDSIKIEDKEK